MVDGPHSVHSTLQQRRLSKESGGKTDVLTAHEVPKLTAMDTGLFEKEERDEAIVAELKAFHQAAEDATLDPGRLTYADKIHERAKRMYEIEADGHPDSPRGVGSNVNMTGGIYSPTRKGKFSLPTRAPEERHPLNTRGLPLLKGPAGQRH